MSVKRWWPGLVKGWVDVAQRVRTSAQPFVLEAMLVAILHIPHVK
jgi:hypothetical protein